MLRMIVCDWNGTLFREPLEKTFFVGLCGRALWRAVRAADGRKVRRLIRLGTRCVGLYCAAKRDPERATEHIARVVDLLNPDVFRGLGREELEAYIRRHARRVRSGLDSRLLEPLRAVVSRTGAAMGVISSACGSAVEAALREAGHRLDFVLANEFRMDGSETASFDFTIATNKLDVLSGFLAERNVDPGEVMYVGDSPQDEACLRHVGMPVVSFWATPAHKQRFSRTCGAFVPADRAAFEEYLRSVAGG
jgi:phosphoserine phosphatase